MSDLIDKRPLLMWLRDYQFENYAGVGHEKEYNFIENLIKGIENEPTVEAIPKDKLDEIVEQLKNISVLIYGEFNVLGLERAIEIVKGVMNERG